jgi:hypothetical protein
MRSCETFKVACLNGNFTCMLAQGVARRALLATTVHGVSRDDIMRASGPGLHPDMDPPMDSVGLQCSVFPTLLYIF